MTNCPRCGKTNVDPVFPHTCTPRVVLLADELERHLGEFETAVRAAEELCRLHAEVKELHAECRVLVRQNGEWQDKVKQITLRDEALLRQALDALEELQYATTDKAFAMADATIDALKERLK
jgi:ElaB/YqjD/DUF883 family membrane-anchored ribosome-binding protein